METMAPRAAAHVLSPPERLTRRAVVVGVAAMIALIAFRLMFRVWIPFSPPMRYDMAEPFLHPWNGLTVVSWAALWPATFIRGWAWVPLVAVAALAVGVQGWVGAGSAWIGISDGRVSPLGALIGLIAIAQICLAVAWIALIVASKRIRS